MIASTTVAATIHFMAVSPTLCATSRRGNNTRTTTTIGGIRTTARNYTTANV